MQVVRYWTVYFESSGNPFFGKIQKTTNFHIPQCELFIYKRSIIGKLKYSSIPRRNSRVTTTETSDLRRLVGRVEYQRNIRRFV